MTNEELYNDLLKRLSHGEHVIFTREDNRYCIISPFKDYFCEYRNSDWYSAIENCKKYIGNNHGYTKETFLSLIEIENWKYHSSFHSTYEPYKVGDRIVVLNCVEEECLKFNILWDKKQEIIIGNILEIKYNNLNEAVYKVAISAYPSGETIYTLPHTAIALAPEVTEEEIKKLNDFAIKQCNDICEELTPEEYKLKESRKNVDKIIAEEEPKRFFNMTEEEKKAIITKAFDKGCIDQSLKMVMYQLLEEVRELKK